MMMNVVELKAFGKSAINRVWKKVVIALMVCVLAVGLLAYSKRCTIIIWHLQANKKTQKIVINEMLERAKPIIERELKMTFPEKVFKQAVLDRNEKTRQRDALADIRIFVELGFENNWLRFKDVHNLSSINGCPLNGFEFALDWNRGNTEEVLAAFNISLLKRKIDKMQVNDKCSFFKELRVYVTKKAKEN
ncbi:MAG: hypothetical protein ABSE89_07385 [Sedimentisphaerales bacterium]